MDWARAEMSGCEFQDKRLESRAMRLLSTLSDNPGGSIPACNKGYAETVAAYRFFQNKKVSSDSILKSHADSTIERISQSEVALLIQDTSELDYSSKKDKIKGLGYLGKEIARGLRIHPIIAVTPERLHLGVVDCKFLYPDKPHVYDKSRDSLPIEHKPSVRWLDGYRLGSEVATRAKNTQVVVVGDRESDIYEIFSEAERLGDDGADWLVRGAYNRRLTGEGEKCYSLDELEKSEPKGYITFKHKGKDQPRDVSLSVYAKQLKPRPPRRKGQKLVPAEINCVLLTEQSPEEGTEAIRWYLLTSLPVDNTEQIQKIVQYYLCRWEIEVFFRTLKTGCGVEKLQLEHHLRLQACLALYLIITWRILSLVMLGRSCPEMSCETVFEEIEWKTAFAVAGKAHPQKPPSLKEMIDIIAQFGGYLARKNDPPPGPKAMWIGLQSLRQYAVGFQACAAFLGK